MGLLILERKELVSKYEQVKASSDSAEIAYKREEAKRSSALAEARKRELNLEKLLGIQKECVANVSIYVMMNKYGIFKPCKHN